MSIGPWLHGAHWKQQDRLGLIVEVPGTGSDVNNRFVKLNATDQAVRAGADEAVLGVARSFSKDGQGVAVQLDGVADLIVTGNVTRGARLKSDAQGRGVVTTTANDEVGAVALEAVTGGGTIQVLVTPFTRY